LYQAVYNSLQAACPTDSQTNIINDIVNASADSFYSSQGRQTSFPDHNEYLIPHLLKTVKDLGSLEMETFHLYHLARSYMPRSIATTSAQQSPLATSAVSPSLETTQSSQTAVPSQIMSPPPRIRAAAAQMVFAARLSKDFITPDEVVALERWTSLGILEALIGIELPTNRIHNEVGSVWELSD